MCRFLFQNNYYVDAGVKKLQQILKYEYPIVIVLINILILSWQKPWPLGQLERSAKTAGGHKRNWVFVIAERTEWKESNHQTLWSDLSFPHILSKQELFLFASVDLEHVEHGSPQWLTRKQVDFIEKTSSVLKTFIRLLLPTRPVTITDFTGWYIVPELIALKW